MPVCLPSPTTAGINPLEFEKLPDGTVRASLTTKRNDSWLNTHNRLMIQHWCTNVDLQIIVDADACARYMASMPRNASPDLKLCLPSLSVLKRLPTTFSKQLFLHLCSSLPRQRPIRKDEHSGEHVLNLFTS